jgi:glycosyltransferase involved in cell wall biosynthesis
MNLFLDAHLFDEPGQGSKTYLKGIFTEAIEQRRDIQFYLAACDRRELEKEFGKHDNCSFEALSSANKFVRLSWDIPTLIRKNKIDIAHFTYISPALKTCPEVVALHDLLFLDMPEYFPASYRLVKNFLFKRSARRAELVTTLSQYSRETIIRYYGIDEKKVIITPCGIVDSFWIEEDGDAGIRDKFKVDKYIVYVSRIEPRKNHLGLLRAYTELALWKKDIQLVFIGSPAIEVPQFTALYESLEPKVKSKILFLQKLTDAEVKAFYRHSLLSVYPSVGEGFGIPPLEAAVCGAQVLCSNATAMEEFTFFGDMQFNPHDQKELNEKISHYIDKPLALQARKKIKEIIRQSYSWKSSAALLFDKIA